MAMRTSLRRRQADAAKNDTRKTRSRKTAIERNEQRGARIEDIDIAAVMAMPEMCDLNGETDWLAAHHRQIPRQPMHAAQYAIYDFGNGCETALSGCRLSNEQASGIAIALGQRGMTERLLLSNAKIRFEATRIFLNLLSDFWRQTRSPTRRWFFITFMGDEGNTLEYRPELRVRPFRRVCDQMLRDAGLNAFGVIELQALTNFPARGDGGTLMVNGHALAWTDDPAFDHEEMAKRLCGSRRLTHWLDWPTVSFTPIEDRPRQPGQSIYEDPFWQIRWRAYYLFKAPYVGKYLARSGEPGREWETKATLLRPALALRLAEGLSQLEFSDVVFGVSGGTQLSRALKSQLTAWHQKQLRSPRNRRLILSRDFDVASLWPATRRSSKRVSRQPFVSHNTAEKRPLEWSEIARAARAAMAAQSSQG